MSRGGNIAQDKKFALRSGDLCVGIAKPPSMSTGRDRKSRTNMQSRSTKEIETVKYFD
jgi:hypothetical protein